MDYANTDLNADIKNFMDSVKYVNRLVSSLGTERDDLNLRRKLDQYRDNTKLLEISISKKIGNKTERDCDEIEEDGLLESQFLQTREPWKSLYRESFEKEAKYTPLDYSKTNQRFSISPPKAQISTSPERKLVLLENARKFESEDQIMYDLLQERNREIEKVKNDLIDVVDIVKTTKNLINEQGDHLDIIESNLEHEKENTKEGVKILAQAAKQNTNVWPVSGAAIGGVILGGLGLFLGPIGMAVGGTTGATIGSIVGTSVSQFQKDVVDKEVFEHHLAEKWIKDDEAFNCPLCKAEFSQLIRKHHCRSCGDIFCSNCSSKRVRFHLEEMDRPRMERVCDQCYQKHWKE